MAFLIAAPYYLGQGLGVHLDQAAADTADKGETFAVQMGPKAFTPAKGAGNTTALSTGNRG
ncbi:hypothetical protein FACS1894140_3480 [Spirochaetia bacterium]|nr:hypothetical protein FACS1894140_3480 [Spirochaetia bacterium]